jgi:hypothetical protein
MFVPATERLPSLAGCTRSYGGANTRGTRMYEESPLCTTALVPRFSDLLELNNELVRVMFGVSENLRGARQSTYTAFHRN